MKRSIAAVLLMLLALSVSAQVVNGIAWRLMTEGERLAMAAGILQALDMTYERELAELRAEVAQNNGPPGLTRFSVESYALRVPAHELSARITRFYARERAYDQRPVLHIALHVTGWIDEWNNVATIDAPRHNQ